MIDGTNENASKLWTAISGNLSVCFEKQICGCTLTDIGEKKIFSPLYWHNFRTYNL